MALTLYPTPRVTYALTEGLYFCSILWLWGVEGIRPTAWDTAGSLVALAGMGIIMFGPWHA